jgi:hypothetical protein
MLRTAMGPAITGWLEDPAIVEIMLNPDGRMWIDRLTGGLSDTGKRLSAEDGERIVRVVAHHVGAEVHPGSPRLSADLPETGERLEGLIPPIVAAPAFQNMTTRKRPRRRHDLHLGLDDRLTAAVEQFQRTCSPIPSFPCAIKMLLYRAASRPCGRPRSPRHSKPPHDRGDCPMALRFTLPPGDVPPVVVTRHLGLTLEAFLEKLPSLLARGFPSQLRYRGGR